MHAPEIKPHTPLNKTTHAPPNKTMHAPWIKPHMPPLEQPCTPPWSNHTQTPPRQPHMPPPGATTHAPLWTEWQTGVKILPCPKLPLRAVKISNENRRWSVNRYPIKLNRITLTHHRQLPSLSGCLDRLMNLFYILIKSKSVTFDSYTNMYKQVNLMKSKPECHLYS